MDYNKTGLLYVPHVTTPSGGSLLSQYGFPNEFMLKRVWLIVRVQGAQVTGGVRFVNAANTTTFATLTAGTSAIGTVVSADVSEDNRDFPAGGAFAIRNIITDATAFYDIYMLIAHSE